eukprot:1340367-Rhodomonas_salina.1
MQAAATIPALQEAVDDANREASKLRDDVSRRRADIKDRKEDIRQLEVHQPRRKMPTSTQTCMFWTYEGSFVG